MRKILKLFSFIFILAAIFSVMACSNGKSGIIGELSYEATRTELEVTADFEENEKLSDSNTTVSVKLYDQDENYKTYLSVKVENNISGKVTFENLTQNTKYILKLFVSIDGFEEELDSIEATTKNEGNSMETAISIKTVDDFKAMSNDKDAYYRLDADLDFAQSGSISLFTESFSFSGKFFGNNHTISNVTLAAKKHSGLFGYLDGAEISDLNIKNVDLTSTTTIQFAGVIAGFAKDSTLKNIVVDDFMYNGEKSTTSYNLVVGGLIGETQGSGSIENCQMLNADIKIEKASKVLNCGLIVANLTGEYLVDQSVASGKLAIGIKNSSATVYSGTMYIGGFIGANSSLRKVSNSYSDVDIDVYRLEIDSALDQEISNKLYVGGFIGGNPGNQCNVENCFAYADIDVVAAELTDDYITKAKDQIIADVLRVGGFIGSVRSSAFGINNCLYYPKTTGVYVAAMVEKTTVDEKDSYSDYVISLTVAENRLDASKVNNLGAQLDKIDFVFNAKYETKNDDDEDVLVNITDEVELQSIKDSCIDKNNLSSNAADVLSDSLKQALNTLLTKE